MTDTISRYGEWEAEWNYGGPVPIKWSGVNLVSQDSLITNVTTNRGGENPFEVQHITLEGSIGFRNKPASNYAFTKAGPSSFATSFYPGLCASPDWTSASIWSRTNPGRPVVHAPVFLFELRELPEMIRQMGRFLLHAKNWRDYIRTSHQTLDLGLANLAFQFGWAPLIRDLYKLSGFQAAVEKRRKEINRLYSGAGLRRKISLGSVSDQYDTAQFIGFGSYGSLYVPIHVERTSKAWAVVKWKPTSPSSLPPSDNQLARTLAGVNPEHILENVWEALPWSWLIDYFTNIGDVIGASNHVLATPAGGSAMVQYSSIATHPTTPWGDDTVSEGTLNVVRKTRFPVLGAPVYAQLPLLGAGQLSILGSLAVVKGRKTLGS